MPALITDHLPEALILMIIGTERVAVEQQDRHIEQLNERRILQQLTTGPFREDVSGQEVTVTGHEITPDSRLAQVMQCMHDPMLVRVRIIVSNPGLEKVAEDIKVLRVPCDSLQKPQQLPENLRASRVDMDVGDEKRTQWIRFYSAMEIVFMVTVDCGTSPGKGPPGPVGMAAILSSTSIPSMT